MSGDVKGAMPCMFNGNNNMLLGLVEMSQKGAGLFGRMAISFENELESHNAYVCMYNLYFTDSAIQNNIVIQCWGP